MGKYLVCGQHSWSKSAYYEFKHTTWLDWYKGAPDDLGTFLGGLKEPPDKIFFTHWSYIVPDIILDTYECICFHPSHLPYGRGGTPIQNLIAQGFTETKLTAFRMTAELDAGPIYLQLVLDLSGQAHEIYKRIATMSFEIIDTIIKYDIVPFSQQGEVVKFKRRTPAQSELPKDAPLDALYDHIRMLSAENYPPAFIEYGNYTVEFTSPIKDGDTVFSNAIFVENK